MGLYQTKQNKLFWLKHFLCVLPINTDQTRYFAEIKARQCLRPYVPFSSLTLPFFSGLGMVKDFNFQFDLPIYHQQHKLFIANIRLTRVGRKKKNEKFPVPSVHVIWRQILKFPHLLQSCHYNEFMGNIDITLYLWSFIIFLLMISLISVL